MPKKGKVSKEKLKLPVHCIWGLICSSSSVDKKTNNISLFNVIENFSLPQEAFKEQQKTKELIKAQATYQAVFFLKRKLSIEISNEEILLDLKIKIINPVGKILAENVSSFKFLKNKQNMRMTIEMQGIVVDVPGLYLHEIEIKTSSNDTFTSVLKIPFQVRSLKSGK